MKTEFCGGGRLAGHNDEQQTSKQTVGKHVVFQHVPTCKRGHAALTRGILSFTCGMIFLSIAAYDSDEPRLQTGWMLPGRSCQGDGMHQCTVPSVLCAGTAALNRCMAMIEQCRHDLHLSSRAAFVGCSILRSQTTANLQEKTLGNITAQSIQFGKVGGGQDKAGHL